ncbi:uncharacterized protein LOC127750244 [Frankliniella occidentalis]|uniref:Uncharacterized protein LOC127750244 n=1 Tax=Frankliniella occidentalis TaxID=133901 RepID=A0A9C6XQ38_FRAOC|nr:uncharacterized protein LOC127750244 [Frankliniella occidentalis]
MIETINLILVVLWLFCWWSALPRPRARAANSTAPPAWLVPLLAELAAFAAAATAALKQYSASAAGLHQPTPCPCTVDTKDVINAPPLPPAAVPRPITADFADDAAVRTRSPTPVPVAPAQAPAAAPTEAPTSTIIGESWRPEEPWCRFDGKSDPTTFVNELDIFFDAHELPLNVKRALALVFLGEYKKELALCEPQQCGLRTAEELRHAIWDKFRRAAPIPDGTVRHPTGVVTDAAIAPPSRKRRGRGRKGLGRPHREEEAI